MFGRATTTYIIIMANFTSQADEKASADMLAVKDNHITALNTQPERQDIIKHPRSKVSMFLPAVAQADSGIVTPYYTMY